MTRTYDLAGAIAAFGRVFESCVHGTVEGTAATYGIS